MKIFYRTEKWKKHSERVARKSLWRRKKRKKAIKSLRRALQGKKRKDRKVNQDRLFGIHVKAPKNFSFLKNPEEVIVFINTLENLLKKRTRVFIVLKNVQEIDYGAITILLSVMKMFKYAGVGFNGDFPQNEEIKKLIYESGFFDNLGQAVTDNLGYALQKDNQIITHGDKNVDSMAGLEIMRDASMTVLGEQKISKGHTRVFVELMQNTNNHASEGGKRGRKHWWLSVNHDKKNSKVSFVFVDHGIGIFASLNQKTPESKWYGWREKAKGTLGFETDEDVLRELLEGRIHKTVTAKKYRGKGLPSIKMVLDRNQISNLYVITNNVFADVNKNNYRLLSNVFNGTFYYWELCSSNDYAAWKIPS